MKSAWIRGAFTISCLWWVYLFFTTQIVVVYDAAGYEISGRTIAHQGWGEFLRAGPQREPMFPWLVACSMQLGERWGISYFYPLKMIGISFLFLTMVFSYRLMRMLSIRPFIAALTILYMGISPVMTNSSMRLWSEFAAYPWVVLAVYWTIKSWKFLDDPSDDRRRNLRTVGHGAMVALMFLLIMFVKAVAEGVLLFYLCPFYWRIFSQWRSGNLIKARQWTVFCLTVFLIFEGVVCAYKSCNYYYNGHFAFTNRGDLAFYSNTARRMEPLTLRRLGAAAAFAGGMGICESIYTQDECDFWSAMHSDVILGKKADELSAKNITGDAATRYLVHSSVKMIMSNPLQELLLMFIEAHKMFFWESSIAFVAYPDWMDGILYSQLFIILTKSILAFLCWVACIFAFCYLCRRFRKPVSASKEQDAALFWVFNFIFWFMTMYSLFFILDRYAFPLISLYMVLVAFMLDKILKVRLR